MICKKCGCELGDGSLECPRCGEPLRNSGGNGFWDIVEPAPPGGPMEQEKIVVKEVATRTPPVLTALCGILCAVSVLSLIVFQSGLRSARAEIRELRGNVAYTNAELSRQSTEASENSRLLGEQISELSDSLDEMVEKMDEWEKTAARTQHVSNKLNILKSPSNEVIADGRLCLFICRVSGSVTDFYWEKQDRNGQWAKLELSEPNRESSTCGPTMKNNLITGESQLHFTQPNAEDSGYYRCVAVDDEGKILESDVALLEVPPVDPAPSSVGGGDGSQG